MPSNIPVVSNYNLLSASQNVSFDYCHKAMIGLIDNDDLKFVRKLAEKLSMQNVPYDHMHHTLTSYTKIDTILAHITCDYLDQKTY